MPASAIPTSEKSPADKPTEPELLATKKRRTGCVGRRQREGQAQRRRCEEGGIGY